MIKLKNTVLLLCQISDCVLSVTSNRPVYCRRSRGPLLCQGTYIQYLSSFKRNKVKIIGCYTYLFVWHFIKVWKHSKKTLDNPFNLRHQTNHQPHNKWLKVWIQMNTMKASPEEKKVWNGPDLNPVENPWSDLNMSNNLIYYEHWRWGIKGKHYDKMCHYDTPETPEPRKRSCILKVSLSVYL